MILRRISLRNFRNYAQLEVGFSDTCNFFFGNNAQGKTNLLEAIHVLAVTRSFRSSHDRDLVRLGSQGYEITGEFLHESGVRHLATVCFAPQQGREVSLDRKRITSAELVGRFPVVHFSPESHRITGGPPAERRRFVDLLLCQSSPSYLADMLEYNRVLRQRNALLAQMAGVSSRDVAVWSHFLAVYGCRIVSARLQFVKEYAQTLHRAYTRISDSSQPFQIVYRSQFDAEAISYEHFQRLLESLRAQEERRKRTLAGPHLDDFGFEIDGREVRRYGSRGEHKSALMALKLAETQYLRTMTGTAPMVLLDDLPSELDARRTDSALAHFHGSGQLFISAVTPMNNAVIAAGGRYEIIQGQVRALTGAA